MLRSLILASLALSLISVIPVAHATADLTINLGTIAAGTSYSSSSLEQIIKTGNAFADTPRLTVTDEGGSLYTSGSAAPPTGSTYSIAFLFKELGSSLFSGNAQSGIGNLPVTYSLFEGATLLETATGLTANLLPIALTTGSFSVVYSGGFSGQEAEGSNTFAGSPIITAPVPEPTSWALMISGFAITGTALRGRSRRAAFAAA